MNLGSIDLSSLEALRPILPLPLWQKLAALGVAVAVVAGLYVSFGWLPIQEEIDRKESQVEQQRALLKKNRELAKDLPRKRREFAELEKQLKVALNMLPKKSQIPDLLESVSRAGKESGLSFQRFRPGGESVKQLYAEVPVSLNVEGTFRQLMTYLRRVGELPRIVEVKNLTLGMQKGKTLKVDGVAVTYRFVERGKKKGKRGK